MSDAVQNAGTKTCDWVEDVNKKVDISAKNTGQALAKVGHDIDKWFEKLDRHHKITKKFDKMGEDTDKFFKNIGNKLSKLGETNKKK